MKIGFVVNSIETEHPNYTTTRIARAAIEMGHEACIMGVGDFAADTDDHVLVTDGIFMVRLDIVGDKLMKINVLSPGGLGSAESLEDSTKFSHAVVEKLEKKVRYRDHSQNDNYWRGKIDNKTLATL